MSVTVTLAGTDRSSWIDTKGLEVHQILGSQRDNARLIYKKFGSRSYTPTVLDTVLVEDAASDAATQFGSGTGYSYGTGYYGVGFGNAYGSGSGDDGTHIFGGRIAVIKETPLTKAGGIIYELDCADYSIDLDSILVAQQYTNKTVKQIIDGFVANFSSGFTDTNTVCDTVIGSISFNQMPMSQAIKKLADLVKFDWYVDADKDIHFFSKSTVLSPYNLSDTDGIHIAGTLETDIDATQLANQVKVRGGTYLGATFSDTITVKGSVTKSWVLPYKFDVTGLTITINGVSKTVGVFGIDTFSTKDVLYRDSDQSIQVNSALIDGDTIAFSGTPLIPVLSMAGDVTSIATYGIREKLIVDSSITNLDLARVRATAEVAAYKDPQTNGKFVTYTAGLRTGQTINLNSSIRSLNVDFIIKQVMFRMRTPTTFAYTVEMVSVKTFTLIELLQSILLPADIPIDPNEVLETIRSYDESITSSDSAASDTPTHPLEVLAFGSHIQNDGDSNKDMTIDCTGADTLIVVMPLSDGFVTSVTCNGVAMTAEGGVYRRFSPPQSVCTISYTESGNPGNPFTAYAALAIKGINTSDGLEDSASGSGGGHVTLSASEASNILSIGIMGARVTNATGSWTPDSGCVEVMDDGTSSPDRRVTVIYKVFSRSGIKTCGTTFSTTPDAGGPDMMALYNGYDPTT